MHNNIVNHNQNLLISKYFANSPLNLEKKGSDFVDSHKKPSKPSTFSNLFNKPNKQLNQPSNKHTKCRYL